MAFEEIVSREIDALYQGALFLTGGAPEDAERLLADSVRASFRIHRTAQLDVDVGAWLQGRLVEDFLSGQTPVSLVPLPAFSVAAHAGSPEFKRVYRAAAAVPALARAVLWLVLFRRWRHEAVMDQLNLERAELRDLLGYRHSLVATVMGEQGHKESVTVAN